jgi:hypothetical protein
MLEMLHVIKCDENAPFSLLMYIYVSIFLTTATTDHFPELQIIFYFKV